MKLLSSFFLAFSTLTALPVPFPRAKLLGRALPFSDRILARSAIFFPLVGFAVGGLVYGACILLSAVSMHPAGIALTVLALPYLVTKFFHFDGLSDVLDGFLANRTQPQRLRIMKDSRVGSFAVGGLTLVMLAKFLVLFGWASCPALFPYCITWFALSRFGVVLLAFSSRYPRTAGTGKPFVGKLSAPIVLAAAVVLIAGMIPVAITTSIPATAMLLGTAVLGVFIVRAWSYRKIGGVTGDVLGAYIEMTELFLPAVLLICVRCSGT
ncbi:MAG: adenosylcobinamide-GDP ribazoletransferase [Spirochaetota bacterium]